MHEEDKAYRSQEIQYDHHEEAKDFLHVHLHGKTHMQANFQTCSNILYQDTQVRVNTCERQLYKF